MRARRPRTKDKGDPFMAGAPLTQTQLPLNAIMDINGTQTYLGTTFALPAAGTSLTNTSEIPLTVIKNPSGSGKSLFIYIRAFSSNLNPVVFRTYLNPTTNVLGATTTPINMRTGATQTSISLCYEGATITSNGTLMDVYAGGTNSFLPTALLVLDQGKNLLITGQQNAAGTSLAIPQVVWYEI